MSESVHELRTPTILVDLPKTQALVQRMQAACTEHGVELRPHMKTHKMVPIARLQLEAGARGLTCAKLSEAQAMLPSGVRELFIAHSLVDPRQAAQIASLMDRVEDFRVGCTSALHAGALSGLAARVGRTLGVMMAVDTGLGREGTRTLQEAKALAATIASDRRFELRGFYTHEGQMYGVPVGDQAARIREILDRLTEVRDAIDPSLPIWPGCSVSAAAMARTGVPGAVRPGSYVFGDLSLSKTCQVIEPGTEALHVLATVVDRPEAGLAIIDAGSKTFSGDATPAGLRALAADGRDIAVVRVNEEHGYLRGADVDRLRVGERLRFVPAHVCTVVNLASEVTVVSGEEVVDRWPVDARGCVR